MKFDSMNFDDYRGRVIAASGKMVGKSSRCYHNVSGNLFSLKDCLVCYIESGDLDWYEIAESAISDIFLATGVSASVDQFLREE